MAKLKKIPSRMCIGCQQMKCKKELLRVVKGFENQLVLDITGKMAGRGAYFCKNTECLQQAIKAKRFERTLKISIDENVFEMLKNELGECNAK